MDSLGVRFIPFNSLEKVLFQEVSWCKKKEKEEFDKENKKGETEGKCKSEEIVLTFFYPIFILV